MLLEIAMADAYGAGFEFAEEPFIKENNCLTKYHQSPYDKRPAGFYTDDTQMTIALCELMINESGMWNKELVAAYFLKAFKRDPRDTYSQDFYHFLLETDSAIEFIENINADSVRNGSSMRSVPLGLIKDKSEMLEKAKIQASLTHNTHEGIVASQAVALAVYYFVNHLGPKGGLFNYVCQQSTEYFRKDKITPTECNALDTIDAVLTVLNQSNSLKEILLNAIQLGGDTDSVACIACGIASCSDEYIKDLPAFLEQDLENGPYGKDYLKTLNAHLQKHYAI